MDRRWTQRKLIIKPLKMKNRKFTIIASMLLFALCSQSIKAQKYIEKKGLQG